MQYLQILYLFGNKYNIIFISRLNFLEPYFDAVFRGQELLLLLAVVRVVAIAQHNRGGDLASKFLI